MMMVGAVSDVKVREQVVVEERNRWSFMSDPKTLCVGGVEVYIRGVLRGMSFWRGTVLNRGIDVGPRDTNGLGRNSNAVTV